MDGRRKTFEGLRGILSSGRAYPGKEAEREAARGHASRCASEKSVASFDRDFRKLDVEFMEPE